MLSILQCRINSSSDAGQRGTGHGTLTTTLSSVLLVTFVLQQYYGTAQHSAQYVLTVLLLTLNAVLSIAQKVGALQSTVQCTRILR